MDRCFAYPASAADHLICYDSGQETPDPGSGRYPGPGKRKSGLPRSQRTLACNDAEIRSAGS